MVTAAMCMATVGVVFARQDDEARLFARTTGTVAAPGSGSGATTLLRGRRQELRAARTDTGTQAAAKHECTCSDGDVMISSTHQNAARGHCWSCQRCTTMATPRSMNDTSEHVGVLSPHRASPRFELNEAGRGKLYASLVNMTARGYLANYTAGESYTIPRPDVPRTALFRGYVSEPPRQCACMYVLGG